MIILGLDLSISKTGICVVTDNGPSVIHRAIIHTKPKASLEARLHQIRNDVECWKEMPPIKTVDELLLDPSIRLVDLAVIEEPIQHRTHKGGQMSLHALYGVIRLLLWEHNIKIEWVHPMTLKAFCAGNGRATKETMIRAVKVRWHIDCKDDNEADAVALAMYGLERAKEWAS